MTRFSFALPEGSFTRTGRHLVAVSPDGASVAYVANSQLYLRRMADLESRPILGTNQDVSSPFFSPDGQWAGFWSAKDSTLKKIAISGGAAVTLCEATNPFGASWNGDTIVFGQGGSGILGVPATGGKPEVWVKTAPDETVDSPQILPGGKAVLFAVTKATLGGSRWDSADIAVSSRDSGERKVLVHGGAAARYVPTGHIVYAVSANLLAVPFDLERLEVTGGPVPIVEGVMRAGGGVTGVANLDLSRDGTLVYVPGTAGASQALVWVDRQGREEPFKALLRAFASPRLSPDTRRVAVQILDEGNDIWTFDLTRGALTRQTFETEEDETPIWSPDGRWVAYASTRGNQRTVFRRPADGSGPEESLWSGPNAKTHSHIDDWTSDGRMLLIATTETAGGAYDLATTVEQLIPSSGPNRLQPAAGRDLPFFLERWERLNVHFVAPRLIGGIRHPAAIVVSQLSTLDCI